ncbi:hypothetical protein A374_08929 [Fictibacillus macauensis ZFHKF-1]|uniref:Uncharacterized protein n=1 Tax=Fictibacillus macauensis ZFHKF-1 TaxID=1196324 RepID=I8AJK4_9BACL|nr:hypothetical protein [Fictibacillus macauensis]EIT85947.1 hypothetical protein A374_08929 [Fictibacillus macauensis ZFHKF-1]
MSKVEVGSIVKKKDGTNFNRSSYVVEVLKLDGKSKTFTYATNDGGRDYERLDQVELETPYKVGDKVIIEGRSKIHTLKNYVGHNHWEVMFRSVAYNERYFTIVTPKEPEWVTIGQVIDHLKEDEEAISSDWSIKAYWNDSVFEFKGIESKNPYGYLDKSDLNTKWRIVKKQPEYDFIEPYEAIKLLGEGETVLSHMGNVISEYRLFEGDLQLKVSSRGEWRGTSLVGERLTKGKWSRKAETE